MAGVVSSILSGGTFNFADFESPSMSILYKNARNVRFVLFRKNSTVITFNDASPVLETILKEKSHRIIFKVCLQ